MSAHTFNAWVLSSQAYDARRLSAQALRDHELLEEISDLLNHYCRRPAGVEHATPAISALDKEIHSTVVTLLSAIGRQDAHPNVFLSSNQCLFLFTLLQNLDPVQALHLIFRGTGAQSVHELDQRIREQPKLTVLSLVKHYMIVCSLAVENPLLATWANKMFETIAIRLSEINASSYGAEALADSESTSNKGVVKGEAADGKIADAAAVGEASANAKAAGGHAAAAKVA
jgi:hypothetical protein